MDSNRDIIYKASQKEIFAGKRAKEIGNIGKARVCARRACGLAIEYWLQFNPSRKWGLSAISMLDNLQNDFMIPEEIREAAKRLTKKVDQNFETGIDLDPLRDGETIIEYFLDRNNLKEM